MSRILKQVLFAEYGGFADKRLKKLEHDKPFIVDDRSEKDFGADKQLYPWFCLIFVRVEGTNMFALELRRNVPLSDDVEALFATRGAVPRHTSEGHHVKLRLTVDDAPFLEQLAKAIESIVARGDYGVRSYKYVCPRTANSLRRLAQLLTAKRSLLATAGDPSAPTESGTGSLF